MIYVHVEVVRSIKTAVEEKYKKVPFGHFFKAIKLFQRNKKRQGDYMIIKLESELAKLNDIKKVIKEMGASL